jgi:MSHA biogenesis protein MshN
VAYFWSVGLSVINQMLKDLDKRQAEQADGSTVIVPSIAKYSYAKLVTLFIIAVILINVIGLFIWQLYSENQQLKTQIQQAPLVKADSESSAAKNGVDMIDNESPDTSNMDSSVAAAIKVDTLAPKNVVNPVVEQPVRKEAVKSTAAAFENVFDSSALKPSKLNVKAKKLNQAESEQVLLVAEMKSNTLIPDAKKQLTVQDATTQPVDKPLTSKPSLTISRKRLSPQALAEKKITAAEQAMENNELAIAESLFEDVLLLTPDHQIARKQLAALWYGKKSYQDAINLLSQGIALAPPAEEMRLMSARIYFEQGRARQALSILNPVSESQRVDLQVLLASVATELKEHKTAASAYNKLLVLEPNTSRWWLGLAVSLDSQGLFESASNAYSQAIAKGNLSNNALQFAQQRIAELGE